ncbi:MAG: glycosyltransferase family 4 protein [Terriglobales bacterium]
MKLRIGLVVPPFITVPPQRYGGTELFVALLAEGLRARGHEPIVYTVGNSQVDCQIRWRAPRGRWPIESALESSLEDLDHSSWACESAARECDLIHLNNAPGLSLSRFVSVPFVYTVHHPQEPALSRHYDNFPAVNYVAISRSQARQERLQRVEVIHHGLRCDRYTVAAGRRDYLCFIGRIAPIKGTHVAIEVARRAGLPLKIAGEIQPLFREYWEQQVRPQLGSGIEYVGELDLEGKNELLSGARALLFPIDWEEPFGLVMIEAMACGVPVLAFGRGSAPEVVTDGISGWICRDAKEMAERATALDIPPDICRAYVERHFSVDRMVSQYLDVYGAAITSQVRAPRLQAAS